MVNYRELIRLKSLDYSNARVASSIGSSRNTVSEVWGLVQEKELAWPIPEKLTNSDLEQLLYPGRQNKAGRKMPDYEYIHRELAKPGVTLTLLWAEYCAQCEHEAVIPYQSTQFNDNYHAYAAAKKATLRIKHKPGEVMEIDWAGDNGAVYDEISGEIYPAYLFVAALPCSLYAYAEAFPDMRSTNWLTGNSHAFHYFEGVTRILSPDNCKTAVIKNTPTETYLNRSYYEMAEHYGTAIIPDRPKKPQDKAVVEGTVKILSTWILAALRHRKFFSFEELNVAIAEKLKEFNEKPFQKKKGSRLTAFLEEEKEYLLPLPSEPYETAIWSTAKIQPDYLVEVAGCKYSVPYEYIRKSVDIRTTETTIEVFYHHQRIASHIKHPPSAEPVYVPEHMPENHRKYLSFTTESFLEWGEKVGPQTLAVVKNFLYGKKTEKQGYKTCISLMKLADRYSIERVEAACERALSYTPNPSVKNITLILKNGQDKLKLAKAPTRSGQYGITRGPSYYGGGDRS